MLKNYKKANKKDLAKIENIYLSSVSGGCSWDDLYNQFEKTNNLVIEMIKNDWICCNNGIKYKICSSSYILNYDGFLRF